MRIHHTIAIGFNQLQSNGCFEELGVEVKKQKEFGREHGCSKLHTEADGQSAKSFPRDERLYGLHVENRIGKMINIWPAGFGRIMVIKHRGRKSGKECLTPVNYAIIDGEIF